MKGIESIISLNGVCLAAIKWRLTDICNYQCTYCVRKKMNKPNIKSNLAENWERLLKALPEVARIINELPGNVKLDLIGGECTVFNLHYLLEELFKKCGSKLKRINLTTNMSESVEYYNDLTQLCYNYGSEIGITCSWHYQFCSMDSFLKKFGQIKSPTNQKGIRVECVSMTNNQQEVQELIKKCEESGFTYFIERDLFSSPSDKELLIAKSSSKKKDRYKITYEDGEEILYKTRNDFLTSNDYCNKMTLPTKDYLCSRDYDYVYIEIDEHIGRLNTDTNCRARNNLTDFHPLKTPAKCLNEHCTLCGQISISIQKELLLK